MRRKWGRISKLPLNEPPPPALVEYRPEAGWPVVVFQILKVRSMPAISKCTCELGSNAILAMIPGCRLGVVWTLPVLSNWVPARPLSADGSVILEPPADPPIYASGFSSDRPRVTWSLG